MPSEFERVYHPFEPVYDENSTILILGSLPSVKSRETNFYYGHTQNRFWKILSALTSVPLPVSIDDKINLLIDNHIAVWDVVKSCDIAGSADNTIRNADANDLNEVLHHSKIAYIYTNGKKADALYKRLCEPNTGIRSVCLPSSSSANASYSLDGLIKTWEVIMRH